jgi:hypothetical protein
VYTQPWQMRWAWPRHRHSTVQHGTAWRGAAWHLVRACAWMCARALACRDTTAAYHYTRLSLASAAQMGNEKGAVTAASGYLDVLPSAWPSE